MVLLIYSWIKLGIPVTIINILLAIISLFGASLIIIGMTIFSSAFSFWFLATTSVMMFFAAFRDYARYPITIFNKFLKFIFTFIIPVGFISFYPSQMFLRPDEVGVLSVVSPIVGIIFFIISYKFWMLGAKYYSGTGS